MQEVSPQLRGFLVDSLGGFSPKAIPDFIFRLFLVALLAFMLSKVYVRFGNSVSNRKAFSKNFLILAITTMFIITVVKSSLALSLGLVGALSIVRFRSAIKEPEELSYLFMTIAIGLGIGAGFALITIIGFLVLCIFIIIGNRLNKAADNQNLYLTISSKAGEKISITSITEILKKHALAAKLKRTDESPSLFEASFLVEFSDVNNLELAKKELFNLGQDTSITFMDNTRDF